MFGLSLILNDVCARSSSATVRAYYRTQPATDDKPTAATRNAITPPEPINNAGYSLDPLKLSKIADRACGLKGAGSSITQSIHMIDNRSFPACFTGGEMTEWLIETGLADTRRTAAYICARLLSAHLIECMVRPSSTPFARVFSSQYSLYRFCGDCAALGASDWDKLEMTPAKCSQWLVAAKQFYLLRDNKKRARHADFLASELVRFWRKKHYVDTTRQALAVGQFAMDQRLLVASAGEPFRCADIDLVVRDLVPVSPHNPSLNNIEASHSDSEVTDTNMLSPVKGSAQQTPDKCLPESKQRRWEFVQSFGDDSLSAELNNPPAASQSLHHFEESGDDLVTSIEFSWDGRFLAIGDKAGRISIVEQVNGFPLTRASSSASDDSSKPHPHNSLEYSFFTEFQSHEPEFDSLKSTEVSARISAIEWARYSSKTLTCLTANDRTVKVWALNPSAPSFPPLSTAAPVIEDDDNSGVRARCRSTLTSCHSWPIHSLSCSTDGQSFVSADDLSCLLWDFEHVDVARHLIDFSKPNANFDELMTAARFHSCDASLLGHGSTKGRIRIADLRTSCIIDQKASTIFHTPQNHSVHQTHAQSELTASILDFRFSSADSGRYVLARDYLRLHLFDFRKPEQSIYSIFVDPRLNSAVAEAVENEAIFDSFHCAISASGDRFVTGSYQNQFSVHDVKNNQSIIIRAKDDAREPSVVAKFNQSLNQSKRQKADWSGTLIPPLSFSRACLKVAWHPLIDAVAIAGMYKLYLYQLV